MTGMYDRGFDRACDNMFPDKVADDHADAMRDWTEAVYKEQHRARLIRRPQTVEEAIRITALLERDIGETCCGKCPGDTCYVDYLTGERS